MKVLTTKIHGLLIIEPDVYKDHRGYFFESYQIDRFKAEGIEQRFIQDNEAFSSYGVIRGLHYQLGEFSQAKLVRVIKGSVLDVAVDLRKDSPTYLQYESIVLSGQNKRQFLVPRGFAHGYSVLENDTIFAYKCDNFYNKSSERGIHPLDPTLNIDWHVPEDDVMLSEKDLESPWLNDAEHDFKI
ncbi:MAG: dTDP-4-dehydrorhamnose 3,5-epimerase [Bacteroidales bacterium]|nr:dTDP-4-dehydrorhamnose 3,5-epimerase [Bacteroidales bacterium]